MGLYFTSPETWSKTLSKNINLSDKKLPHTEKREKKAQKVRLVKKSLKKWKKVAKSFLKSEKKSQTIKKKWEKDR